MPPNSESRWDACLGFILVIFTGPTSEVDEFLHFMAEPHRAETLAATVEA